MKTKKIIALLLTMMMIVGSIPVFSLPTFAEGENQSTTPADTTQYTEVATYDALVAALGAKQNVKLTADITFPATAPEAAIAELWDGAVIDGNGFGFKGVTLTRGMFTVADGAHFTIKDLTIEATLTVSQTYTTVYEKDPTNATEENVESYFGVIADIITNVSFELNNVIVTVTANDTITGTGTGIAGLIGYVALAPDSESTVYGCTVNGSIIHNYVKLANYWANGFISKIAKSSGTISFVNSTNNAEVKGSRHVSGFTGETYAAITVENCINNGNIYAVSRYASGLISYTNGINVSLNNCTNTGEVYVKYYYAAGVLAKADDSNVSAENCINRGNITSDAQTAAEARGFAGIVGDIATTGVTKTIFDFKGCKNYGAVEAGKGKATNNYQYGVGGIVGCTTINNSEISFIRCSNFGALESNETSVGGILGCVKGTSINSTVNFTNCLNMGTLKNKRNVAAMLGAHLSKNANTVNIDSCVNVADINSGAREGYMLGFNYSPLISDYATSSSLSTNIQDCIYIGKITSLWSTVVDTTTVANPSVEIDEQIRTLNTYCMGYFYNDNGTIKLDEDVPQLYGAQDTYKAGDTEMDVRFVAVLRTDKLNNYESIGFKVTPIIEGASEVDLNCSTVFTSLLGQGSESVIQYTAGELGGNYIFALSVTDVPTTVSFKVTPYATQKVGNDKIGVTWLFEYVDGKLTGTPIYE